MTKRKFLYLASSGYSQGFTLSGRIGGVPDTALIGVHHSCRRSCLPVSLDQLVVEIGAAHANRNFFYANDFFIVRKDILDFFVSESGSEFEVREVQARLEGTRKKIDGLSAVKIISRFSCIDEVRSTALVYGRTGESSVRSFANAMVEINLAKEVATEYQNAGPLLYQSYPSSGIKSVSLLEARVPANVRILEPDRWPGTILIEQEFAQKLERLCTGGASGYYFWTVDLNDVSHSLANTMRDMR